MSKKSVIFIVFLFLLMKVFIIKIPKVDAYLYVPPESIKCEKCGSAALKGKSTTIQNSTCHNPGIVQVTYGCCMTKCMTANILTYETGTHEPVYEVDTGLCTDTCVFCKEQRGTNHKYKDYEKTPTCTENGYTRTKCKNCGKVKSENVIMALGHDYKKTTIPSTCASYGYDLYECNNCDSYYKTNYINALEHDYVNTRVLPTCTTQGYIAKKCSNCGYETTQNYGFADQLGHDWAYEIDTYPTCAREGSKSKHCQREGCTAVLENSSVSIPATGNHSYSSKVTEPTCKQKGYITYTCSGCGKNYKDNYTDIVDHCYEFVREQELTCIWNNFKYYECKWCNKGKYENIELTTGHKWEGATCSTCGEEAQIIAGPWDISADDETSSVTASLGDVSSTTVEKYVLIITGTGNMKNFSETDEVPWKEYRDKIYQIYIEDGVANIGNLAFASVNKITTIDIPESITSIGISAFLNCENLEYISIPYNVTNIGAACFFKCNKLKTVRIFSNLEEIEIGTFEECVALQNINLPKSLKTINLHAFYNCGVLENITIPKSIKEIGTDAFYNVNNTVYYYLMSTEVLGNYANQSNFIPKDKVYIFDQPINHEIAVGGKASFFCMADSLSEISYQWYKVTGTSLEKIDEATEYNYQTESLEETEFGYLYFCEVSSEGETVRSNTVKAINTNNEDLVTITKQPENVEIARGEKATFEIEGYDEFGPVEYTWYYNEGTGAFQEITKDVGNVYSTENGSGFDTVAYDNEVYWNRNYLCVVSNQDGTVTSNIVSAVESETKQLVEIRVVYGKTEYVVGQKIDKSKITVEAIYNDGSGVEVADYTLSNENELTLEDSGAIQIVWLGQSTTLNITVEERQICKIEMTEEPTTTVYKYGQCFDNVGMVITAIYNDDTTEEITNYSIENEDNLTCVNNTVVIKYEEFSIPYIVTVTCNLEEVEKIDPTCLDKGTIEYECSECGEAIIEDYGSSLGHEFRNYVSNNDATCERDGTKTGKCIRCDETEIITDENTALAHDWRDEYIVDYEPTCTETGSKSIYCTKCNQRKESQEIAALGHDYEEEFTVDEEPTCDIEGLKSKHCTRCDARTEIETIESIGHDYEEEFTVDEEPTCTTEGLKSKHCTRCDAKTEIEIIEVLEHSVENYESNNDATCAMDGTKTGTCSICNETVSALDEGSALGHKWEENFTTDKEPTCTEIGIKSKHCTRCEMMTEISPIEALEHSWNEGETTIEPTCTEEGEKTYTCTVCKETKTEEIEALGHTEVIDPAVAATCIAAGKTEGKHCSVCSEVLVAQTEILALGHSYEDGECIICQEKEPEVEVEDTGDYEVDALQYHITKIQPKTKVKDFIDKLDTNASIKEIYKGETKITDEDTFVGTGMQIKLRLNEEDEEGVTYTLIVRGDVDGDGLAGFDDIIEINEHRLGKKTLTSILKFAGNVDDADEELNFWDIVKINEYRLGKILENL